MALYTLSMKELFECRPPNADGEEICYKPDGTVKQKRETNGKFQEIYTSTGHYWGFIRKNNRGYTIWKVAH